MMELRIEGAAFEYMLAERGDIALGGSFEAWRSAQYVEINRTLNQIRGAMRDSGPPMRILDIGSGVGAIDVAFCKLYGAHCTLVDGEDGGGVDFRHDQPFGSRKVAEQFFSDNGVDGSEWTYLNPEQFLASAFRCFDLVISTRAWCFHIAPQVYLHTVQRCVRPGAALLLDVRAKKTEWRLDLATAWHEEAVVQAEEKFNRIIYSVEEVPYGGS